MMILSTKWINIGSKRLVKSRKKMKKEASKNVGFDVLQNLLKRRTYNEMNAGAQAAVEKEEDFSKSF